MTHTLRLVARVPATLVTLALSLTAPALAEDPPTVALAKCTDTYAIGCNEPFCLTVSTTGWDALPADLTETPEVAVQFKRDIRDTNGQELPGRRATLALPPGPDTTHTLHFRTDDGPLLFEFVDIGGKLVAPDDSPFTLDPDRSRVVYRMSGDACQSYLGPNGWFNRDWW